MSATTAPAEAADPLAERRDALRAQLNDVITGMFELCAVYLGEQLGYYEEDRDE